MDKLDDYKKVQELASLYKYLDWLLEKAEDVKSDIKALAANMSPSDIRYAIQESDN